MIIISLFGPKIDVREFGVMKDQVFHDIWPRKVKQHSKFLILTSSVWSINLQKDLASLLKLFLHDLLLHFVQKVQDFIFTTAQLISLD